MLKLNTFLKEQNVRFSLKRNKDESWVEIEKSLSSTEDLSIVLFRR